MIPTTRRYSVVALRSDGDSFNDSSARWERLRALSGAHRQAPDTPVVLISATYIDDAARTTATYAGAVDFLAEPVPSATLVERMRHHIGGR